MADNFSVALEYALDKLLYKSIRDYQRQVVKNYMSGKDVFFSVRQLEVENLLYLKYHLLCLRK